MVPPLPDPSPLPPSGEGLELTRGLIGAARLAIADPGGLALIDTSAAGAWRSFRLLVLAVPLALIAIFLNPQFQPRPELGMVEVAALLTVFVVLNGVALPSVLHPVFGLLKVPFARFCRVVAASNWASLFGIAAQAVLLLALRLIGVGPETATLVLFAVSMSLYLYEWYVFKVAMDNDWAAALGLLFVSHLVTQILLVMLIDANTLLVDPYAVTSDGP